MEGQLAIKQASQAQTTYVAHCANDYAGYIAPLASYTQGGHEIPEKPAMWTRLAPGSLERITLETGEVLEELFR